MSKNRMISNELMMALIKYHILDIKDNEEINCNICQMHKNINTLHKKQCIDINKN